MRIPPRTLKALMMQSLAVTAVAKIRMQTSLGFGTGLATSLSRSTSGGPYLVQTTALIDFSYLKPRLAR
jgi:hypothetical protein